VDSRRYFVQQVAKTILDNHDKDDSSFIFGISGKWGEGKTRFLKDLETEIKTKDPSVKVYLVNPWKFSSDKVAFMRDFLKSLNVRLSWKSDITAWVKYIFEWFKDGDSVKNLEFDKTRNKINWGWVFGILALIGLILFIYHKWPDTIQSYIDWIKNLPDLKWLITALLLPIFVSFFSQLVTAQKSSQAISTVEQFDRLLTKIIKRSTGEGNKIIVFVDDLDRVTPEIARSVLDNLRTFFDKPQISFIVTGDHTILERHLGRELLPDRGIPEQLEEGRRFLKKIFNVYWRLPLPITTEVRHFITERIQDKNTVLSEFFTDDQKKELGKYLEKYFDKNFRHIIRFLDTVAFTFQVIKLRKQLDEANKSYFEEILKHPLLVVRVLMFQELCAPFFEEICDKPELLGQMEYAAETKSTDKINAMVNDFKDDKMSVSQKSFISKFVYEEPRFYLGKSLRVTSIEPFLFLAADASLGDQRGPSSEDFLATVDSGDPEQVKNSIVSMGDQKAKSCIEEFKNRFNNVPDVNLKDQMIRTLSVALFNTPDLFEAQNVFLSGLGDIDFDFYDQLDVSQKSFVLSHLWAVLDRCDNSTVKDKFIPISNYKKPEDISGLDQNPIKSWGTFSTQQVIRWLVDYYPQNNNDSINRLYSVLGTMKEAKQEEIIEKEVGVFKQSLIDKVLTDGNTDYRLKVYEIIKNSQEASMTFKTQMLALVKGHNEDISSWLLGLATTDSKGPIITNREIQETLINDIKEFKDKSSFLSALSFSVNKISDLVSELWEALIKSQSKNLLDSLADILSNSHYQKILPTDPKQGELLFELLIKHLSTQDESEIRDNINYFKKDYWFWAHISNVDLKLFTLVSKAVKDDEIKEMIDSVKTTWRQKTNKS
jgi:hypothetical protein